MTTLTKKPEVKITSKSTEKAKTKSSTVSKSKSHLGVEKNPIGLDTTKTKKAIPMLDTHVASLFTLFHQYQKHHWMVFGPQFRDLHLYLEEAYEQIHEDLDALAERMTILGGTPTSSPEKQAQMACFKFEQEGERPVRDMLKADLAAEQAIIGNLRESIKMMMELSDYGTEKLLKEILFNSEDRAHHLDHYLEKNTLTPTN